MLYVLIDNGHGFDTPGKRSPILEDKSQFFEYKFCRKVAVNLYNELNKFPDKFKPILITPENNDISLVKRVLRINSYCKKYGAANCIMISIHVNAAGNGGWMSGRGWSAWTTKGVTISDKLAECLYSGAEEIINNNKEYINSFNGQKTQKPIRIDKTDGDKDYESNFYIIKGANCAAVLTENFFMDNKTDVKYLMSERGIDDVVNIHLKGIKIYAEKYNK